MGKVIRVTNGVNLQLDTLIKLMNFHRCGDRGGGEGQLLRDCSGDQHLQFNNDLQWNISNLRVK